MTHTLTHILQTAHRSGTVIDNLPPAARPQTPDEAYALADELAAQNGQPVVGWKIGAANGRGQAALRLSEPFAGRVFGPTLHCSPGHMAVGPRTLTIGAEFALRIARDLRVDERFDERSIAAVVDGVAPSLELNWASYSDPFGLGGLCIIADNGFNIGMVLGQLTAEWQKLDLGAISVQFRHGDGAALVGSMAGADFNPFAALAWLANDRAHRGDPLRAGQFIATGDFIGAIEASAGSSVSADFGPLGRVELTLTR
ncbi:MAG: hypothetical protein MUD01_27705 [Chloroflexaceae bacterium]|jgi:2-keto-4-pentenoate hydratase|nr:hypothetical protein [Chloroflexaceae bacterium]